MAFKKTMWNYYKTSTSAEQMLVIANNDNAKEVIGNLEDSDEWYYNITGAVIYDENKKGEKINDVLVVAGKNDLYETVVQMMVDEVFICLPNVPATEIREMVTKFEEMGLTCHYNVDLFSRANPNTYVQQLAGYSVISFALKTMDSRRLLIKRFVDIIGALVGLIITAVITPFVAIAIKIDSQGPVFFSQTRIGKNGRRFKIWKFRSMYVDAEERKKELENQNEVKGLMFKMENDPRITKVGRFLRKTSIDETPQFLNILVGDMSLVGTRPPTEDEFEKYNGYYRRRMSITPGLTGMWQVSGRSDIQDFEEIVRLDLEYIDNWSLGLDIKILFMTVFTVLGRKGSK
jgi:exopolysaccharide biosynthesis polyprenyl glycosylphosphotransferase